MIESVSTKIKKGETAVLVSLIEPQVSTETASEHIDELEFLASTLGVKSVNVFTQKLDRPDKRTFVGKGKMEEIVAYVKAKEVDMVIFDDDLSPSQLRNLEKEFESQNIRSQFTYS